MTRRKWMSAVLGVSLATLVAGGSWTAFAQQAQQPERPRVTVYKSPTCGCCSKWVDHMRANGFTVVAHDIADVDPIKRDLGLPGALASCHTGVVNGYVIEGHVPAATIHKLLREKPKVHGLAVPGMPMGSPGMEGPTKDRYDVVAFDRNGRTSVFASY